MRRFRQFSRRHNGSTYSVTAFSDASDSSIVSGVFLSPLLSAIPGQTLSTVAEGEAGGSSPPVIQLTAVSQASAGGTFYTSGPLRAGFIEFVVQVDHLHGGDASASLSDGTHGASNVFYSAGPFRLGLIQFDVSLSHLHGGISNAVLTDGIHQYTYNSDSCGFEGCQLAELMPFDLGSECQISTSGDVSFHGYDDALIVFRLLESDGVTPVPFSATPEPATWALLLFGSGALWLAGTNRRQMR